MARAPELSRRAFVGAVAASLTGCPESEPSAPQSVPAQYRVAVVGAGLAGLSCAYWLTQAGVDVTVYEAGTRTGGRILTLRNELPEPLFAELGGEFIEAEHATMWALAGALGVALSSNAILAGQRVLWVDDRRLPEDRVLEQLTQFLPTVVRALEAAEQSEATLVNFDATPLSRWLERNAGGAEQSDLLALLNAAFRAEFGRETDQQSSLNLLQLIGADSVSSRFARTASYRARDGADLFTRRLEEQLARPVRRESRLVTLVDNGSTYSLAFESPTGRGSQFDAERVVLALPFSVLRSVDLGRSGLSADKIALIDAFSYGSHTKLVGAFGSRDWTMRQVICDLPFQLIWDSSVDQPPPNGLLTNLLAGKGAADGTLTAEEQLEQSLPDVERALMTPLNYLSGSARRVRWTELPNFRGSIASPNWGQWLTQASAGQPEGNVHFCGEHTSVDFRGTMEGAAESGALVATRILRDLLLPEPAALARLIELKSTVSQPCLRDPALSEPLPLARRRTVLASHTAFVSALNLAL